MMRLNKQYIVSSVLALSLLLTGCATTTSHSPPMHHDDDSVLSQHNVENFGVGALIGIPLGFFVPVLIAIIAS